MKANSGRTVSLLAVPLGAEVPPGTAEFWVSVAVTVTEAVSAAAVTLFVGPLMVNVQVVALATGAVLASPYIKPITVQL